MTCVADFQFRNQPEAGETAPETLSDDVAGLTDPDREGSGGLSPGP